MAVTVKLTNTSNHFIIVDGSKETVICAASESDALNQYNNKPIENDEHKLLAQWDVIRYQRNQLMQATDWTQIPDAGLSEEKKSEFAIYRQALRDIPQNTGDPYSVTWPVKPE